MTLSLVWLAQLRVVIHGCVRVLRLEGVFGGMIAATLWTACGDTPSPPALEIVGHADLGARGMNAGLAIAGNTAYIGSRDDAHGIAIVDIANPERPVTIGELATPVSGLSSRELRAIDDLDLLVVLNLQCSPELHGCGALGGVPSIDLYDITDRGAPTLLSSYVAPMVFGNQPMAHEMFVWRDPVRRERVLVFATMSAGPSLVILDATDRTLQPLLKWDVVRDGHIDGNGTNNSIHSVGVSADGTVGYISHQTGGLALVDLHQIANADPGPTIEMITPPADVFRWSEMVMGAHSAVPIPDRPYLVVTEEIYPAPFSVGCPWGALRTVDVSDPAKPVLAGQFGIAENDPATCANLPTATAYTAHNATVMRDLALVTWYAGGLEAIDLADPKRPTQIAELRPEPLPAVEREDPVLGGEPVEMWSYPIISKGLVYVVDVRNGLYAVRYSGPHSDQLAGAEFLEGNSNL